MNISTKPKTLKKHHEPTVNILTWTCPPIEEIPDFDPDWRELDDIAEFECVYVPQIYTLYTIYLQLLL